MFTGSIVGVDAIGSEDVTPNLAPGGIHTSTTTLLNFSNWMFTLIWFTDGMTSNDIGDPEDY